MPKQNFQATEGLLHDVMRKQSGVIEKAWLEALMNSVDANATEFHLDVTEDRSTISDDGDSMTEQEVQKYFSQFGLKDSDITDKEFGKFRMGRGQIFNFGTNIWRVKENYMVVDLDNEATTVNLEECTATEDDAIVSVDGDTYNVQTEGLSYVMLDAKPQDDGLSITVDHYEAIDDVNRTIAEFKKLARYVTWFHNVDVYVNGSTVGEEPDVIEDTELAYYIEPGSGVLSTSEVYNKGALVNRFNLGPVSIGIISKADLDVTLDRTDILDSDPYWGEIKKEYKAVATQYLKEQDELNSRKREWLVERAADSPKVFEAVKNKPLLKDVSGDMRTISEVEGRDVGFAEANNKSAEAAMDRGDAVILDSNQQESFKTLASGHASNTDSSSIRDFEDIIQKDLQFEMSEIARDNLSKRRLKHLEIIESALDDLGVRVTVKAGYSNHKDVWKDKEDNLYIHKDRLNCRKSELATSLIQRVVIVASHGGETMTNFNEDISLRRAFYKTIGGTNFSAEADYATVQRRILDGYYK
ncbi:MAG: hypothetical protein J07AB43_02240 [Candidatus Nanosalina sp. J07AB43]|nr:MAG: hypothetical protein J07AB43_02240 [Candidatus Nanosalina sp. J07AB43]